MSAHCSNMFCTQWGVCRPENHEETVILIPRKGVGEIHEENPTEVLFADPWVSKIFGMPVGNF